MRILLVHERYRLRGGEDTAFDDEVALLRGGGAEVVTHIEDNRDIHGEGGLSLAVRSLWSPSGYAAVRQAIRANRADLVHAHNTFPLLSPSVYDAARAEGVPMVQTLYNYRLLCPNALLMRDGMPCESCLGRTVKWPGVVHACYRDSRAASAAVAALAGVHWLSGTWRNKVDRYFAQSEFARGRFIAGGLPAERIAVKPNGRFDPGPAAADWNHPRAGALYVGRLSREKGVAALLAAWTGLDTPLTVIGEGPEAPALESGAPAAVRFAGWIARADVSRAMSAAVVLAFPSLCYENAPMAIVEAHAHGLPVVASDIGAIRELVEPNVTGLLARPGDVADWHDKLAWLLARPEEQRRMGANARRMYERRHAPETVFAAQMDLYRSVLEARR